MTPEPEFVMLQCKNPDCRFRCPSNLSEKSLPVCPICGSPIVSATAPFTNQKLARPQAVESHPVFEVMLDNLRSTLNVGSIFRTADGAGIDRLHLCGTTPTPEHPKIAKTGLGAEWTLPWEMHRNGLDFTRSRQNAGVAVISLEAAPSAKSIFDLDLQASRPVLLVVGNEVSGIDPGILEESDLVCSIPMSGVKSSLNVAVAFGIAVYTIKSIYRLAI